MIVNENPEEVIISNVESVKVIDSTKIDVENVNNISSANINRSDQPKIGSDDEDMDSISDIEDVNIHTAEKTDLVPSGDEDGEKGDISVEMSSEEGGEEELKEESEEEKEEFDNPRWMRVKKYIMKCISFFRAFMIRISNEKGVLFTIVWLVRCLILTYALFLSFLFLVIFNTSLTVNVFYMIRKNNQNNYWYGMFIEYALPAEFKFLTTIASIALLFLANLIQASIFHRIIQFLMYYIWSKKQYSYFGEIFLAKFKCCLCGIQEYESFDYCFKVIVQLILYFLVEFIPIMVTTFILLINFFFNMDTDSLMGYFFSLILTFVGDPKYLFSVYMFVLSISLLIFVLIWTIVGVLENYIRFFLCSLGLIVRTDIDEEDIFEDRVSSLQDNIIDHRLYYYNQAANITPESTDNNNNRKSSHIREEELEDNISRVCVYCCCYFRIPYCWRANITWMICFGCCSISLLICLSFILSIASVFQKPFSGFYVSAPIIMVNSWWAWFFVIIVFSILCFLCCVCTINCLTSLPKRDPILNPLDYKEENIKWYMFHSRIVFAFEEVFYHSPKTMARLAKILVFINIVVFFVLFLFFTPFRGFTNGQSVIGYVRFYMYSLVFLICTCCMFTTLCCCYIWRYNCFSEDCLLSFRFIRYLKSIIKTGIQKRNAFMMAREEIYHSAGEGKTDLVNSFLPVSESPDENNLLKNKNSVARLTEIEMYETRSLSDEKEDKEEEKKEKEKEKEEEDKIQYDDILEDVVSNSSDGENNNNEEEEGGEEVRSEEEEEEEEGEKEEEKEGEGISDEEKEGEEEEEERLQALFKRLGEEMVDIHRFDYKPEDNESPIFKYGSVFCYLSIICYCFTCMCIFISLSWLVLVIWNTTSSVYGFSGILFINFQLCAPCIFPFVFLIVGCGVCDRHRRFQSIFRYSYFFIFIGLFCGLFFVAGLHDFGVPNIASPENLKEDMNAAIRNQGFYNTTTFDNDHYAICENLWGEGSLDIVDISFLTELSYRVCESNPYSKDFGDCGKQWLIDFFPDLCTDGIEIAKYPRSKSGEDQYEKIVNRREELNIDFSGMTGTDKCFIRPPKETDEVKFYHIYSAKYQWHVISIRGTKSLLDYIQDFNLWKEISFLQIVNFFIPILDGFGNRIIRKIILIWDFLVRLISGNAMHSIFAPNIPRSTYYHRVSNYIKDNIFQARSYKLSDFEKNNVVGNYSIGNEKIYITGHSLGGGLSKVVGMTIVYNESLTFDYEIVNDTGDGSVFVDEIGEFDEIVSFSFAGPGILLSSAKFFPLEFLEDFFGNQETRFEERMDSNIVNIKPEIDVVSAIDYLAGLVQNVGCPSQNPLVCHSSTTIMGSLLRNCGNRRTQRDFDS